MLSSQQLPSGKCVCILNGNGAAASKGFSYLPESEHSLLAISREEKNYASKERNVQKSIKKKDYRREKNVGVMYFKDPW